MKKKLLARAQPARTLRTSTRGTDIKEDWQHKLKLDEQFLQFHKCRQLLGVPFLTHFGDCSLGMQKPALGTPVKTVVLACALTCARQLTAQKAQGFRRLASLLPVMSESLQCNMLQIMGVLGPSGAQRNEIPKFR